MSDHHQSKSANALVVDSDPSVLRLVREVLEARGYRVSACETAEAALQIGQNVPVQLAVIGSNLPGMSGLDLVRVWKSSARGQDTACLVTTDNPGADALRAILDAGADDCVQKPLALDALGVRLSFLERRVVDLDAMRVARDTLAPLPGHAPTEKHGIVAQSRPMLDTIARLELAAKTDVTVMLRGESGTGKELAARVIHNLSARAEGPFVAINCGAIPASLLESELFGHVKGAFTGADAAREGLLEAANGGTLFLDEIGDIDPYTQVKLLRALQERVIRRVGDSKTIPIDVRIVSATNRDLESLVSSEEFREDFYYRVNVFELHLPPLRERAEDIPALVDHLLGTLTAGRATPLQGVTQQALDRLMAHTWPGNIRELQNALEYALVLVEGDRITADHLPARVAGGGALSARKGPRMTGALKRLAAKEQSEVDRIRNALADADGVKSRAAELLGISRVALWKKMKKLEMAA